MTKLYADRPFMDLEPYYSRHVAAMTSEGLHSKSDIAAELAWRDARIAELRRALECMYASAHPNERDHPTMSAAWKATHEILEKEQ